MTLHTWKCLRSCEQLIKNSVEFGNTETEPICSIYLGKRSGGHPPYPKEKGLAKELVCLNTL